MFGYTDNFEKISYKRWRNFRATLEKFRLNLQNHEEILRKSEDFLRKFKNEWENLKVFRENFVEIC